MEADRSPEAERSEPAGAEPRRLSIAGIHHVSLICSDLDRAVWFYRDVLGMRLITSGTNQDDPGARQFFLGDRNGAPGTLISLLEYPGLEPGRPGAGAAHHFALRAGSDEELEGWREYLASRGVPCTTVLDRTHFQSIYLRDPDGHIVEIATTGAGFEPDEVSHPGGSEA